jgi:hypothetical protein
MINFNNVVPMLAGILAVEVKPMLKSTMTCFLVPLCQVLYKSHKVMKDWTAEKEILQKLPPCQHHRRVIGLFTSFGLNFALAGFGWAGGKGLWEARLGAPASKVCLKFNYSTLEVDGH